MVENIESTTKKHKESKMQYWLRLGIKISIASELLILLALVLGISKLSSQTVVSDIQNSGSLYFFWNTLFSLLGSNFVAWEISVIVMGGMIIAVQVYLYREIGSSLDEMNIIKKVLVAIFVGIPSIYFGSFVVFAAIAIIALLIALWAYTVGQDKPATKADVRKIVEEEIRKY